jgi:phosphatidylserine decarboxylase
VLKSNERVNLFGQWTFGFFGISFVGATNVGSIKIHFDEPLKTNRRFPEYVNDRDYSLMSQDGVLTKRFAVDNGLSKFHRYIRSAGDRLNALKARTGAFGRARLANERQRIHDEREYKLTPDGVALRKGQEMGMFQMGSTIVLMFECPMTTKVTVKEGSKL